MVKKSNIDRLSAIRNKLKKTDLGSGRSGFWSPKTGKNTIRILPEVKEMGFFFQEVGRHTFPPDGKKSVYCPSFTSNSELDCPVCELVDDFYKAGDKASKAMASALKLRRMYWMNVIDRGNEEAGPQVYTPGQTVFGSLVSIIQDPDYGDITDVDGGIDITIERKGTGLATEYEVRPKPRPSPLNSDPEVVKRWLADAKDLSYVEVSEDPEEDAELSKGHAIYVLPYDRIVEEFGLDDVDSLEETMAEDEEETKEEEEKPHRKAKPSVVEDEDDEDDEDDDEEEEVPAKKEVARRRVARRASRR